ncbi:MAG: hypothetical protein ACOYLP_03920 [Flavobacterium sp.]|uniref:hypothetical protein n=1 Tax=Flavobacterium sp. TaxID=239 RepID=UPI003BBA82CA
MKHLSYLMIILMTVPTTADEIKKDDHKKLIIKQQKLPSNPKISALENGIS